MRFKDEYKKGRNLKTIYPSFIRRGISKSDFLQWFISELENCEVPPKVPVRKVKAITPDEAIDIIKLSHHLKEWLMSVSRCLGSWYQLKDLCSCFPRSYDIAKLDIARLKDIVCFLKQRGCLDEEDFLLLRKKLKRAI